MITYEATAVCDGCQEAMIAGDPATHPMHTRASALMKATDGGWKFTQWGSRPRLLCPDCQKKPHGGTTNGENSEGNQTG